MSHSRKSIGRVAGGALAVAVFGLTGCSSSTDSGADKEPAASNSPAADADKPADEKEKDASSNGTAADQSTAEGAVAGWVTAVIKGEPKEACLLMGEAATDASPARHGDEATCGGDTPEAKQIEKSIGQFRTSFTPKPPTDDPKVEVTQPPAKGDEVAIPADKITVDGQTLERVILSNSTGVKSEQLDVKVHSTKMDDLWYVTNLDFDIG
ncbi:hypothetical protein ACFWBR_19615 [Streptomyces sp. NPDC060006]|uniref:hypothetical protein n=1 Tax=unclassified Streptomyces TaxID=2593676 RepID=UPI003634C8AF